jgi:head-tail adaptor
MLTTADLTAMRTALEASLPDTATISRLTRTADGAGGYTEAWATTGSAVACRVSPTGSQAAERQVAAKLAAVAPWTVTLPAETDVTTSDRILTGGRTLQVEAVMAPRSWEVSRRVMCQEIG